MFSDTILKPSKTTKAPHDLGCHMHNVQTQKDKVITTSAVAVGQCSAEASRC